MAYEQLEEINDRKSEKMALFLTAENFGGLLVCAGPVYLLSTHWPFLLRLLAVGGAVVLGVALTSRVQGLPLYTRILWHVQGLVWMMTGRRLIVLDHLVGSSRRTPQRMLLGTRAPARIVKRVRGESLLAVTPRVARRTPLVADVPLNADTVRYDAPERTDGAALLVGAVPDEHEVRP